MMLKIVDKGYAHQIVDEHGKVHFEIETSTQVPFFEELVKRNNWYETNINNKPKKEDT